MSVYVYVNECVCDACVGESVCVLEGDSLQQDCLLPGVCVCKK